MLRRSPSTCVQSADCQWSFGEYIYGSCGGSLWEAREDNGMSFQALDSHWILFSKVQLSYPWGESCGLPALACSEYGWWNEIKNHQELIFLLMMFLFLLKDFKKEERGDAFAITFASVQEATSAKRSLHRWVPFVLLPSKCFWSFLCKNDLETWLWRFQLLVFMAMF